MQAPQQMEATLRQMPDQYLMSEMQRPTGRVPQYLVMAEMQRRKQLRQSAQGAQAEGNPPTVADDMMVEAQGIASLPAENMGNIPDQGVVGMAEGGLLPFGGFGQEHTPPSLTAMERARLREERRRRVAEGAAAARERLAREREDQPEFPGPMDRVREMFSGMDAPDLVRFGPEGSFLTQERREAAARAMAAGRQPWGETLEDIVGAFKEPEGGGPAPYQFLHPSRITPFDPDRYPSLRDMYRYGTLPGLLHQGSRWVAGNFPERQGRVDEYGRTHPILRGDAEGTVRSGDAGSPGKPSEAGIAGVFRGLRTSDDGGPSLGPVVVPPEVLGATPPPGAPNTTPPGSGSGSGSAGARIAASGLAGLMPRGGPKGIEIDRSAFQSPEIDALEYMDRVREVRRAAGVEGEPGQETQRYLDESRADIASRRDNRMSNALMNAGLAMMAGESPYFFTNVGRGLQQGVQTYRDIGRELTAEERENQRLAATVEAAQRAERTGMADAALTAENRRKAENLVGAREYAKLDTETQTKLADIASRYDIAQAKINAAIQAAEIRSAAGPAGDPVMARQIVKGLQDAAQMGQEAVNAIISETGGASVDDRNRRIAAVEAGLRTLKNAYGPTALGTGLITPEALDDMFTYIRLTP